MSAERAPDRFRIEALLGEGGFCTVHRARDLATGTTVALKILRPEKDTPEHRDALRREHDLLSRLKHPNLIEALGLGTDERLGPYLVLELFEGEPLRRFCQAAAEREQIEAIVELCRALNFLHARGLVHGDLKPENVLVARTLNSSPDLPEGGLGLHVKLLDLGLAAQTKAGHPLPRRGTPSYVAPEVLAGMPADHRADLYSLGVLILDSLLPVEVVARALDTMESGALDRATDSLPANLGAVARALLAKDPDRRPPTGSDVIEALASDSGSDIPIETFEGIRAGLKSIGMIGRRNELQEILTACTNPSGGEPSSGMTPSVFLLHGEAGVGKTLLLNEIAASLSLQGVRLHRDACPERGPTPFHPFRAFLEGATEDSSIPISSLRTRSGDTCEAEERSLGWDRFHRANRLDQVTQALATRLASHGGVVIVEDLQLADEETFEVFLRLVSRARFDGFKLIASFRTEGLLAARLDRLIESHFTAPHVRSIRLERLSLEETEEVLRACLGPHREASSLAATIHRISEGNPLFLVELLRALIESGQITGGPFRWKVDAASIAASGAPRVLRDLVRRRLAGVPDDAYELLGWLSVLGEPAGIALIHEASGLPYAELRRLIGSILGSGLITRERRAGDDVYWFSHDLYRKSVYEMLSSARRQQMHRSVGVALERLWGETQKEKSVSLACHFTRGGDEKKGPRYAISAGALARRRGAFHQAVSLYHDALNLLQEDQIDLRYEVLEVLAGLLRQIGEPVRSETYYYEMLLAARSRGDEGREAIALTQIGRIQADRGNLAEAEAFARRALQRHTALGNAARQAEAILVLGYVANMTADNKTAVELGEQAKSLAEAAGSRWIYGVAANNIGLALASMRRYEEALPEFLTSLRVAEEIHDIIAQTIALSNIGWVHLDRGRLEEADPYFSGCLARATDEGLVFTAGLAGINLSEVARLGGDLSLSRSRARTALATMQRAERSEGIQYCIYTLGLLDLEEGALGEAKANLTRALGMSEEVGAKGAAAMTLVAVGDLDIELGDLTAAEMAYLRAAEGGQAVGDDLIRSLALAGQADVWARSRLDGMRESGSAALGPPAGPREARSADADADRSAGYQPPRPVAPEAGQSTLDEANSALGASGCTPAQSVPCEASSARPPACRLADEAFAIAERIESPLAKVRADLAGALACLAGGDLDGALTRAHRAAAESESRGLRPGKARALLASGMIHARAGRPQEADSALRDACALADEMGLAAVRARALAEMAALALDGGDHARADELGGTAADLLLRLAQSLPEPGEQDRFLSVPWRRSVLERAAEAERRKQQPIAVATIKTSDIQQREAALTAPSPDGASRGSTVSESSQHPPATGAAIPDPDLRTGVARLLDEALRDTVCDRGLLFLIGPDGTSEIVVARGLESESIHDARSYCRSVIEQAAHGEEIFVVDTSRDDRFSNRRSVSLFHIVSIVCVPLKIAGRVIGALYLDSRAGGRLLRPEDFQRARSVGARMTGSIGQAWERERLREERLLKQKTLCQTYRLDAIVGESPAMRKLFRILEAVIASDCNVLLAGESGTGKELAARAIHFSGRRKMAPFVPLDCGALQDSLVESELFGYRRGAFTGAEADRAGLFEESDGGTLFLDEITNTSTLFQAKLLRALQSGEFRRVGDTTPRKVDVRIIAATNADVEEAIRAGRFREDLYYRLNVVAVRMPPLRERPEDIPPLAEQFAKGFCEKEKIAYKGIGESALRRLCEHRWPGNVRELKNAIESALILSRDGAVRREFIPESLRGGSFEEIRDLLKDGTAALGGDGAGSPAGEATRVEGPVAESERRELKDAEDRARIEEALSRSGGDKSLAAGILGWSRMTLYRKMRRLGIDYATGKIVESSIR